MNASEFRRLLEDGPLLGDGGVATALVERGAIDVDGCFELLNIEAPDVVAEVHQAFTAAGARFAETNTFGANRFNLARHGLEDRVRELNAAGVELARRSGALVAGSVGPLHVRLAPYGRVKKGQAIDAYAEQVEALAEAGCDFIVIETQSDLVEMEQAFAGARRGCDLPVIVTATFTRDDRTLLGSTPEQVARGLAEGGADAVGVNCSEGPAQVLRILHAMRGHTGNTPLVAMPNAGGPARVGERIMYPATPEYFGDYARAFLGAGARILGGCCGTSPEHIRAMGAALDAPRQLHLEILPTVQPEAEPGRAPELSAFGRKLREGRFVVTVEMDPPKGYSPARMLAGADTLAQAGADAINVADSPGARMRMSPWAPARLIQEHTGLETVLHFPTRGRNLLRIQGDLLAAHALGIRNLFVVMGDPARIGDYPAATDNVDVVPTGLLALVKRSFNEGRDQAGGSIGEPTSFVIGCAVNIGAEDLDRECRLLRKKIDSGADFALSQPPYSADVLPAFRKAYEERYGPLQLPIVVGILPLVTVRHAEFLHNELPGITIPEDVRARMRDAGDEAEAAGLEIAIDLARDLREHAAGLYVMPPFNRIDLAAEILEAVHRD